MPSKTARAKWLWLVARVMPVKLAVRSGLQCVRVRPANRGEKNAVGTGWRICGDICNLVERLAGCESFSKPVKRPGATIHAGGMIIERLGEMWIN